MSLLLNILSRLIITILPRSKRLLISWLQSTSAVILEPKKINSDAVSTVSPSISHEVMGPDAMIFIFWMLSFKPTFSLSSFTFIKRLFSSSSLSAVRVVSYTYLRLLIFLPGNLNSSLCFFQSSVSHDKVDHINALCSIPLIYASGFIPVPYCLLWLCIPHKFDFEIMKQDNSSLVPSQALFGCLGSSVVPHKF